MPNVKTLIQPALQSGATVVFVIKQRSTGYMLDNVDGVYRATPATKYIPATEDVDMAGRYVLNESRTAWADDDYDWMTYYQTSGPVYTQFGAGELETLNDLEVTLSSRGTSNYAGGEVASVAAAVTVGTNNDKTGYSLSAAGVQAIWDALSSALTTASSIGKRLVDYLTGDTYARLGVPAGASISADVAAVKGDTARAIGLLLQNHVESEITYDSNGNKTSSVLYCYDSAANATTHDGATGLIAKVSIAAAYDSGGNMVLLKGLKIS